MLVSQAVLTLMLEVLRFSILRARIFFEDQDFVSATVEGETRFHGHMPSFAFRSESAHYAFTMQLNLNH